MKLDHRIRKRTRELIERGEHISAVSPQWSDPGGAQMLHECRGWLASAQNIVTKVFPNERSPYQQAAKVALAAGSTGLQVGQMTAVLKAMLFDIDAGVVSSVAAAAMSEVFDAFLDQAVLYLHSGKAPQAGVVAAAVFEATLRRVSVVNGLEEKGIGLDQLITTLVHTGLLTPIKAKRARTATGLGSQAMHAEWSDLDHFDVQATIATTRDFIDQLLES